MGMPEMWRPRISGLAHWHDLQCDVLRDISNRIHKYHTVVYDLYGLQKCN